MSLTNALKIVPWSSDTEKTVPIFIKEYWLHNFSGTPIYFYKEEVDQIELVPYRQIAVQTNLQSRSFIYDSMKAETVPAVIGGDGILSTAHMINIDIIHAHSDTRTRIDSFVAAKACQIYYKYLDDATAFKIFIIDPKYVTVYKYGYHAAMIVTTITAYETANFVRKYLDPASY